MVDIHNHLLFGIDDGSKNLEDSIEIINDMYKCGYDSIILTPHYIRDSKYNSCKSNNLVLMSLLQKTLDERKIPVKLYLGNEIYIEDDIYSLLRDNEISSLNSSGYLLIELPMSGEYDDYIEVFSELLKRGFHVILAHPERYLSFQKDFNKIYELEKMGILFQSNIDSLVGKYGASATKMIKRLLKEKKISFLSTDIHHKKHDYNDWEKARKIALKYMTEKEYNYLVDTNPRYFVSSKK